MNNFISASVLSADMLNLSAETEKLRESGADMLHFDVMDGVFVNNITYGLPILEQIRKITDLTLDVHLMITKPERYVKRFAEAGADIVTFHLEASENADKTIDIIKESGVKVGLAIKPATPAEEVFPYLEKADMILVMTVEPGFGGQSFIPETVEKVRIIREELEKRSISADIQVDGGINADTADIVKNAGANVLVSGSYLFKAPDMKAAVEKLRKQHNVE